MYLQSTGFCYDLWRTFTIETDIQSRTVITRVRIWHQTSGFLTEEIVFAVIFFKFCSAEIAKCWRTRSIPHQTSSLRLILALSLLATNSSTEFDNGYDFICTQSLHFERIKLKGEQTSFGKEIVNHLSSIMILVQILYKVEAPSYER